MINGFIKGQELKITHPVIVADTLDYLEAEFHFMTNDWDGFDKWAHLSNADQKYEILLENGEIKKEKHLNLSAGEWSICLHGTKDNHRITTETAKIVVKPSCIESGEPLPEVPPTAAEQITQTATNAERIAQSVRDDADAGKFKGEKGEKGDKGDRGERGLPGDVGSMPNITAGTVESLPFGSAPSVTIGGTEYDPVLNFGIPEGKQGERGSQGLPGTPGEAGRDGVSPTVTVSETSDGAVITATDASGTTTAKIKNGAKGEPGERGERGETGAQGIPGVQGIQGVKGDPGKDFSISKTYASVKEMNADFSASGLEEGSFVLIDTGNVEDPDNAKVYVKGKTQFNFIVDLSGAAGIKGERGEQGIQGVQGEQGEPGANGTNGAPGKNGTDGKTPVKGVDYWTASDKQEIVDEAAAAVDLSNYVSKTTTDAQALSGNFSAKYVEGTWLKTTATTRNNTLTKVAMIDDQGWIYYMDKSQLVKDVITAIPAAEGVSV